MNRLLLCLAAFICAISAIQQEFAPEDSSFDDIAKRKSAYMRFGRSDPEMTSFLESQNDDGMAMEKRKSAYMRFGKRSAGEEQLEDDQMAMEKRKSAYMRFGKRKSAYMRFGKRSPVEPMIADFEPMDMEKRKSAYMRFGK